MGDIPAQIKIVCPGCRTQFRLKLKKGRFPEGDIPCPRCGVEIPVVEENLRHDSERDESAADGSSAQGSSAPRARVFEREPTKPSSDAPTLSSDTSRRRSGTVAGSPRLSGRKPSVEDDDLDRFQIAPGLTESNPKSTFLGMGAGLMAIDAKASKDSSSAAPTDRTAVVDSSVLEKIRNSTGVPKPDTSDFTQESKTKNNTKPLSDADKKEAIDSDWGPTTEQDAVSRQALKDAVARKSAKTTEMPSGAKNKSENPHEKPTIPPFDADPDPTSEVPRQMVLGRIKIKQKLRGSLKKEKEKASKTPDNQQPAAKDDTNTSAVAEPAGDVDAFKKAVSKNKPPAQPKKATTPEEPKKKKSKRSKPSLAALLKKARERKIELPAPAKRASSQGDPKKSPASAASNTTDSARQKSAAALDRALNALADETARALDDKVEDSGSAQPANKDRDVPAYDTGDSTMIELLRRRVAENQQPGAASERRGSGYIRLPTAEIQDVLGQGTYRLRVEDIIYEPIDKAGLTELVKRGVLMGAAEIAQSDGDWMPLGEHPVLAELRQKMAIEAHDMLAKLKRSAGEAGADAHTDLPADKAAWPARHALGAFESSADDFADLKDSTEMKTIPTLRNAIGNLESSQADFDTVNSGLFDDVDGLSDDSEKESSSTSTTPHTPASPKPTPETPADKPGPPKLPAKPGPVEPPAPQSSLDEDTSSVELDYDALGVREEDVVLEDTQALDDPLMDTPSGSSGTYKPVLALAAIILAAVAFALSPIGQPYVEQLKENLGAKRTTVTSTPPTSESPAAPQNDENVSSATNTTSRSRAIDAARTKVNSAANIPLDTPESEEALAAQLAADGDHAQAALLMGALWEKRREDAEFGARYYNELIDAQRFSKAGAVAIQSMIVADTNGKKESAQKFKALFEQAIQKNPALGAYHTVTIDAGTHADAAELVLEGKNKSRMAFNLAKDDKSTFVFKPSQSDFMRDWRMSVGSWRLCQIIVCNFDIPRARPARIKRAALEKLVTPKPTPDDVKLATLNWVSEDGDEYVYGALIDATDAPARFPIEYISLWRPWLASESSADLEQPLAEGLAPLKSLDDDFYTPLLAQSDDVTLSELASQVSSVLFFDYLTNNWDRFRKDSTVWGTHIGLHDGMLVSTANLSAFQPRASTRVKGRFDWSSRFSRTTVESLRLIEPKLISPLLFPKPSAYEKARLEVFWSQRERALKRVDALIAAHGQKEVLRFD